MEDTIITDEDVYIAIIGCVARTYQNDASSNVNTSTQVNVYQTPPFKVDKGAVSLNVSQTNEASYSGLSQLNITEFLPMAEQKWKHHKHEDERRKVKRLRLEYEIAHLKSFL